MTLNVHDRYSYSRQIAVIGEEGQDRLKQARVLIAGMGGLGSVLASYLAMSGIGFLRIVDNDKVDESNLNRQFLYWPEDVAKDKTAAIAGKLTVMNPSCQIEAVSRTIDDLTVENMVFDVHLIVDALDNYATRHVLNRAAVKHEIPLFHGAVRGFYGQAITVIPGRTACMRCIFAEGFPRETFPILGPTCGVIASVQATEVIKYITGIGALLIDRMFVWNGRVSEAEVIDVERNPDCSVCGDEGGEAA
jgi:molybdopterin/thiamine biosynthesis adenylyltransferase